MRSPEINLPYLWWVDTSFWSRHSSYQLCSWVRYFFLSFCSYNEWPERRKGFISETMINNWHIVTFNKYHLHKLCYRKAWHGSNYAQRNIRGLYGWYCCMKQSFNKTNWNSMRIEQFFCNVYFVFNSLDVEFIKSTYYSNYDFNSWMRGVVFPWICFLISLCCLCQFIRHKHN